MMAASKFTELAKRSLTGFNIEMGWSAAKKAIGANDSDFIAMCSASTCVKGDIIRSVSESTGIAAKYEGFLLNGKVSITACIVTGNIINYLARVNAAAGALLLKHGNAIEGMGFDDSVAGKLKRELYTKRFVGGKVKLDKVAKADVDALLVIVEKIYA